jgi:type III secretory pathway component EscR
MQDMLDVSRQLQDQALNHAYENNANIDTTAFVETLVINIGVFISLIAFFETTRFYKQIFLKRHQKRFIMTERVPPIPSDSILGWLKAINEISEGDILTMVGLDAYMYLRFIKICLKISVFLTLWGLVVLVPTYGAFPKITDSTSSWDQYTIANSLLCRWMAGITAYATLQPLIT